MNYKGSSPNSSFVRLYLPSLTTNLPAIHSPSPDGETQTCAITYFTWFASISVPKKF